MLFLPITTEFNSETRNIHSTITFDMNRYNPTKF
ncbi:hypothetical protein MED222_05505 [Vibrio sp. MED222]|nr:hypothetical protein MED222_05505 [Vibrio sp. MED222]